LNVILSLSYSWVIWWQLFNFLFIFIWATDAATATQILTGLPKFFHAFRNLWYLLLFIFSFFIFLITCSSTFIKSVGSLANFCRIRKILFIVWRTIRLHFLFITTFWTSIFMNNRSNFNLLRMIWQLVFLISTVSWK